MHGCPEKGCTLLKGHPGPCNNSRNTQQPASDPTNNEQDRVPMFFAGGKWNLFHSAEHEANTRKDGECLVRVFAPMPDPNTEQVEACAASEAAVFLRTIHQPGMTDVAASLAAQAANAHATLALVDEVAKLRGSLDDALAVLGNQLESALDAEAKS
jgi:hypothetical protein